MTIQRKVVFSPMADIKITIACGPYDRTEALKTGEVKPEGIDLTYIPIQSPPEIFSRMIDFKSFDGSEMSLSQYVQMRANGNNEFTALPIFPSRVFRHGFIFVKNTITSPKDLEGKTVGVPEYWQTAAVWIRGILQHEYDVNLEKIRWIEGGVDVPLSPKEIELRNSMSGYRPEILPLGKCLSEELRNGDIDATIGARKPACFDSSSDVTRLFPNYREVEKQYFQKTNIFPIMHTFVVRTDLYNRNPWIAESLYKAFMESKRLSIKKMHFTGTIKYTLPWLFNDLEEIDEIFEGDPWPYGIAKNRHVLDAFATYLHEQHFIKEPIGAAGLFAPILDSTQ